MCAEDLNFLITRAGWLVTHINAQYTFEQSKFKKDFVIMNKKSRQAATSCVKKDIYKLLNNNNIGIDYRNNIDHCTLKPIYDDFSEIAYIKNYTTRFNDETLRDFFSLPLLKQEIIQAYNAKKLPLAKNTQHTRHENILNAKEKKNWILYILLKKTKKLKKGNFKV